MSCLGVHFAITDQEVAKLKSFDDDSDRLEWLQEEIEETYFSDLPAFTAESDKAWDAMHRLLGDGDLTYDTGPEPLRFLVIGGEPLYFSDDYIMSLKTPEQVKAVAAALPAITLEQFGSRYDRMDAGKYGFPKSDEDCDYTWQWFQNVASLFTRAAADGRHVLFTVDQ